MGTISTIPEADKEKLNFELIFNSISISPTVNFKLLYMSVQNLLNSTFYACQQISIKVYIFNVTTTKPRSDCWNYVCLADVKGR